MQGLKWRLSFTSNSNNNKQAKRLKILWNDFYSVQNKQGVHDDTTSENEMISKIRTFLLFVEEILNSSNQREKTSMIDELSDELVNIFMSLLEISKTMIVRRNSNTTTVDDTIYSDDNVNKLLSVTELLSNSKGSKVSLSDKMTTLNEHIKGLLDIICLSKSLQQQLIVLRVMKTLVITEGHFNEIVRLRTFDRLSFMVENQDVKEPSLIIHIMSLYRHYWQHNNISVFSYSNSQHFSDNPSERLIRANNYNNNNSVDNESVTPSITVRSINLAVTVVSELLKLAPSSATTWINSSSDDVRAEKEVLISAKLANDDVKYISSVVIPLHILENTTHKTADDNSDGDCENRSDVDSMEIPINLEEDDAINASPHDNSIGMCTVILIAIGNADCPAEAIEVFSTLEYMLNANSSASDEFGSIGGYEALCSMLLRVEENLILLSSCRDSSLAAATGVNLKKESNNNKKDVSSNADSKSSEESNIYFSHSNEGEFDYYYSAIITSLLNIIIDDLGPNCSSTIFPSIPSLQKNINNVKALTIINFLINSNEISLVGLAVKVVYALLRANSLNLLELERLEIISSLIDKLIVILLSGCLSMDIQAIGSSSANRSQKYIINLFADIILVLQVVAVATSRRDYSLLSTFSILLMHVSHISQVKPSRFDNLDSPHGSAFVRCHNCEVEPALLECINEGCIGEKFFRLCGECDKVFHKSSVKRSHIRVPVINYNRERTNTTSCDFDIDKAISNLIGSCNEYSKAVLLKNNILSDTDMSLNSCSCFNSKFNVSEESHSCQELFFNLLLSSVRGILDDRIARTQNIAYEVGIAIFVCLRMLMASPSFNRNDEIKLSNYFEMSDLADYRDDVINITPVGEKLQKHDNIPVQPPSPLSSSNKRIKMSILVQIIARFLRNHEDIRVFKKRQQLLCLHTFFLLGCDAALIHSLLDTSNSCQLTIGDKQFVIWLLREIAVVSMKIDPAKSYRIFSWFKWLLKSDVIQNNVRITKPSLHKTISITSKNADELIYVLSPIPSANNPISLSFRLMILQELRLLLNGMEDKFIIHPKGDKISYSTVDIVEIPLHFNKSIVSTLPMSSTTSSLPISRSNSFDLYRDDDKNSQCSYSSKGNSGSTILNLMGHATTSSTSLKEILMELEYVELLLDIFMGDLCSSNILHLLSSANDNNNSDNVIKSLIIGDTEKEDWYCALTLLIQIIISNDKAKERLDKYIGIKKIISFLNPIMHFVSKLSPNIDNFINYKAILVNFYIDLCITEGRFTCPSKSFFYSSPKFPIQTVMLNLNHSNHKSSDDFTTKKIPSALLNKAIPSSATSDNYFGVLKKFLYVRPSISIIKEDVHDISDSEYYQQIFGSQSFSTSYTSLSPIYFSHDSTIFQIGYTMKPFPLSLSSHSVRKVFHNLNSNSNSLNNLNTVNSTQSVNIFPITVNKNSISRPHSLVRNVSDKSLNTAQIKRGLSSLHNLDDSRWDSDSNNGESNNMRRGSFSSNHSLLALSHALRPISVDFVATSDKPNPCLNEGALKILDSYINSIRKDLGVEILHENDKNDEQSGLKNQTATNNGEFKLSPNGKINVHYEGSNIVNSYFPFPPMIGKLQSVPLVNVPFFNSLGFGNNSSFETNYLVLLHNLLIIRSGLMMINDLDTTNGQKEGNEEELAQCKYVLRKHLSLYVSPNFKKNNNKRHSCVGSINNSNWQPLFSRIKIRSLECGNLLLSLALSLTFETQAFILTSLSYLIDGNPSNAHMFISSSRTCISLIRLIPVLKEGPREAFGYIVSQILRYSVQVQALTEIIKLASFNDSDCVETDDCKELYYKTMLFSMGRVAENINPTTYLHFDQNSSLNSSILLPQLNNANQCLLGGFSINCWLRLGSFGESPNWSFTQLSSANGRIIIDVYFRIMYRFNFNMKENDNASVTSGFSNLPGDYMQSDDSSKKVIQLCISFHKPEFLAENISELSPGKSHRKTKSDDFSSKPLLLNKQHRKELSADYLTTLTSNFNDIVDEPHISFYSTKNNAIRDKSIIWNRSVHEFFNGETHAFDDNDKTGIDFQAISVLTDAIARFSIPDVIVDFDWSEMGDWHLLNLSFGQLSEKNEKGLVTCSVDGLEQNILYWTPLGYQFDSKSRKRKMAFKSQNNASNFDVDDNMNDNKISPLSDDLLITSIFPYSSLANISKENPLSISVGGLSYENQYYKRIIDSQDSLYNSIISIEDNIDSMSNKYNKLIRYFESIVVGFNGSIGDYSIIEGSPDLSQLYTCVKEGPSVGFLSIKNNRLCSLTTNLLPKQIKEYSVSKAKTELIQFPSFLMSPSSEIPFHQNSLNIFQSSEGNFLKEGTVFLKPKSIKEKDIILPIINNIQFNNNVQIHHTSSIISAFNRIGLVFTFNNISLVNLQLIGGIKVLYPMLVIDMVRLIAGLRIIGCAITSSQEFYNDFICSGNDKVLLYCCVSHTNLLSLETLQVIFDLITHSYGSFGPSLPTYISSTISRDSIHRESILETLFDIIITNTKEPTYYARNCIDWLREICDEMPENCQKVLKAPGFQPLLVLLSIWNIGLDDFSSEDADSINLSSSSDIKSDKLAFATSSGGSIDLIKRNSLKPNFLLSGSQENRDVESVDMESHSPENFEEFTEPIRPSIPTDYKPIELDHIPSNKYNDIPRDISDRQNLSNQSLYVENYKLQLSCSRLIKQLIQGTSVNTPNHSISGSSSITTGFSSSHVSLLLSFALFASRTNSTNLNIEKNVQKKKNRKDGFFKKSLHQMVGNVSILKNVELCNPSYWIYSSALVVLDNIIEFASGSLDVSTFKNSFPVQTLWYISLDLMGAECLEIRERGLDLLFTTLCTSDGKVDAKLLSNFERMQGFKLMNDRLCNHVDASDDIIVQSLLNLMFWKSRSVLLIKDLNNKFEMPVSADTEIYPKRSISSPFNRNREVTHNIVSSTVISKHFDDLLMPDHSIDPMLSGNSSANPSVIMSIFNWSNSKQSSSLLSSSHDKEEVCHNLVQKNFNDREVDRSVSDASSDIRLCEDSSGMEDDEVRTMNSSSPIENFSRNNSSNNLYTTKVDNLSETKDNFNSSQPCRDSPPVPDNESLNESALVMILQIPQLIEVLMSVLQFCKSPDLLINALNTIENNISLKNRPENKKVNFINDSKGHNNQSQESIRKNSNKQNTINVDLIFAQKDWLLCFCETIMMFKRRMLNVEEADNLGINSYSESESLSGYESSVNDQDICMESEDNGESVLNKSINSGSSAGTSNRLQNWQENQIAIYTAPIFRLINTILVQDMDQKLSSTRKWTEIFRLSLPETYEVQEAILMDILEYLEAFPSEYNYDLEKSMNFLRNIGALFEQVLEKSNISLYLCCKVVQALHTLSYRCPPEIRAKIKETVLPELRKHYVIRCLLENSQDFYTRVFSIIEINPSLQGYLISTESKLISNQNILVIIFGMLIEGFEDLEFLFGVVNSELFFASYDYQRTFINDKTSTSNEYSQNSINDKIYFSIDLISSIIQIIQSCINSSQECRKLALKILSNISGDRNEYIRMAFFNNFNQNNGSNNQIKEANVDNIASDGKSNIKNTSSNSWWSGWSSNNNDTGPNDQPDIQNLEPASQDRTNVNNIIDFIKWIYRPEHRTIQSELRGRILLEVKPVLRASDKIREKCTAKFSKFSRQLQEKRSKEKAANTKSLKACKVVMKSAVDKLATQFQKDLKSYTSIVKDKIEIGRAIFTGNPVDEKILKSPASKETKRSALSVKKEKNDDFSQDNYPDINVSNKLKDFLVETDDLKPENFENVLNLLISYFNKSDSNKV